MKTFDIAVVGAGPAGIMSAIVAAKEGRRVVLLEKNENLGRKILATGNGRCNLTNKEITSDRYHGANPEFIKKIISAFDQHKTMGYFESLGVILKEEDRGRIFPRTNQAGTVLSALEHELSKLNVVVETSFNVIGLEKDTAGFIIKNDGGESIRAKKAIITTGGRAAHQYGSSGDGLHWAKKLGHKLTDIYAALVPIETKESWPKEIQGLKIEGLVKILVNEKVVSEKTGDLLFTHFGLSGPAIMDQSRLVAELSPKKEIKISIDAIPEQNAGELNKKIEDIFNNNGAKTLKNCLSGIVPGNLVQIVLQNIFLDPEKKAARVSKEERNKIVTALKNITLTANGTRLFKEAQVTAGGISAEEIDPKTMESKIVPNLYFAGEIIDVDGDSGGFNLQWAWSSGYLAGVSTTR